MKGCYPFTLEQERKIVNYFRQKSNYATRNIALVLVGNHCGFRISEILSLKVKDVYQDGQIIDRVYVTRAAMKGGKKVDKDGKEKKNISASGRSVLLNKVAKKALMDLLNDFYLYNGQPRIGTSPEIPLFHSRKGSKTQPIDRSHAWKIINTAAFNCGIHGKIGTHSMRKTFASRMFDLLGGNIGEVQKALGHKKIDSTMQYLDFKQGNIDEAIKKLGEDF